jgi:hypothetical protein
MQRRPSRRKQHASTSPDIASQPVAAQEKRGEAGEKGKTAVYVSSKISIILCVLPLLAIVALFVRFYYFYHLDVYNSSHFLSSLHSHGLISSSSTDLDIDNRIYENGKLHPDDYIYREATTQRLNWSITSGYRRPDGVKKKVYLINGLHLTQCLLKTFY